MLCCSGASIRGDQGKISFGAQCSIQDCCVFHSTPDTPIKVGNLVTIGHGAILHSCTVEDYALIGMGAVVSDGAHVGEWAVVAEGCIVKNKQQLEPGKIYVGLPAKSVGDVSQKQKDHLLAVKQRYVQLTKDYKNGEVKLIE